MLNTCFLAGVLGLLSSHSALSLSLPCVVSCFVLACMLSTVWRPACHDMPFVHFSGWGVGIALRQYYLVGGQLWLGCWDGLPWHVLQARCSEVVCQCLRLGCLNCSGLGYIRREAFHLNLSLSEPPWLESCSSFGVQLALTCFLSTFCLSSVC